MNKAEDGDTQIYGNSKIVAKIGKQIFFTLKNSTLCENVIRRARAGTSFVNAHTLKKYIYPDKRLV